MYIYLTDGCLLFAKANKAFIIFSLSPIYLETRLEALRLKKVHLLSFAMAFANNVLPFPGGPYMRIPLGGERIPVNKSGLKLGRIKISLKVSFTSSKPAKHNKNSFF